MTPDTAHVYGWQTVGERGPWTLGAERIPREDTSQSVYHREGDRWYDKTKHGSYITEYDAIHAGNRAAER